MTFGEGVGLLFPNLNKLAQYFGNDTCCQFDVFFSGGVGFTLTLLAGKTQT